MKSNVIVLDNGGGTIKAGWAGEAAPRFVISNTAARIKRQQRLLIGEETENNLKDLSQVQFMRPIERGYITDAFTQQTIWERVLGSRMMSIDKPQDHSLLLTMHPFTPMDISRNISEVVFETFGFGGFQHCPPGVLSLGAAAMSASLLSPSPIVPLATPPTTPLRGHPLAPLPMCITGTGIVVDSGFSSTHVYPFYAGQLVEDGIKRVDVGGKFLTNYLKEIISYRQWNMMHDTLIVNGIKEKLCFASLMYDVDLQIAQKLSTTTADKMMKSLLTTTTRGDKTDGPSLAHSIPGTAFGPQTGSASRLTCADDGYGYGFRREYVLPDYVLVQKGFVRGSSDDDFAIAAKTQSATTEADDARVKPSSAAHVEEESTAKAGSKRARPSAAAKTPSPPKKKARKVKRKRGEDGDSPADDDTDTDTLTDTSDGDDSSDEDDDSDGDYKENKPQPTTAADTSTATSFNVSESDLQILTMNSERFAIPELLFSPSIAGLHEGGVHEAIASAIASCPADIQDLLWSSILLTGGNTHIPGLEARLAKELRSLAPSHTVVRLYTPPEPHLTAWVGGSRWGSHPQFQDNTVTKAMYAEYGHDALMSEDAFTTSIFSKLSV